MLFVLSQIIIIFSIIYAENDLLKISHIAKYVVLGLSLANNVFYRIKYAKIDIAKDSGDSKEPN